MQTKRTPPSPHGGGFGVAPGGGGVGEPGWECCALPLHFPPPPPLAVGPARAAVGRGVRVCPVRGLNEKQRGVPELRCAPPTPPPPSGLWGYGGAAFGAAGTATAAAVTPPGGSGPG